MICSSWGTHGWWTWIWIRMLKVGLWAPISPSSLKAQKIPHAVVPKPKCSPTSEWQSRCSLPAHSVVPWFCKQKPEVSAFALYLTFSLCAVPACCVPSMLFVSSCPKGRWCCDSTPHLVLPAVLAASLSAAGPSCTVPSVLAPFLSGWNAAAMWETLPSCFIPGCLGWSSAILFALLRAQQFF